MAFFDKILYNLPEVQGPTQKKLSFKQKLKWTLITLILFLALSLLIIFPTEKNEKE